jgi:hypothetical protein
MESTEQSIFFKAMMTGLFIGVIDTIICLSYNIAYRNISGYTPSFVINVSSLIFAVNLILLFLGMIYFLFTKMFGKNDIIFTLFIVVLTVFLIWKDETGHRFSDAAVNAGWRGLSSGILLILGVSAALLPFFSKSRFFEKHVI